MPTKEQLRTLGAAPNLPSGVELMQRINDGAIKRAPNEYIEKVRLDVIENCDEMLEVGARIRPLMVDNQQIGWVRGIHGTERRRLSRWVFDSNQYVTSVLGLATTLTPAEINDLSSVELHNLVELIQKMTDYDVSLFPYLSAFASTFVSENLWHSRGTDITSFENKIITLPDGKTMRILIPPDHSRLWATLCVYREQAKVRLDASWNAVLQVRPMAGKSVDPLANELKAIARQLVTNSMELWESIVTVKTAPNLEDGWAHSENMDTREGMLRELHGMLSNDRHEQFMAKFEKQQIDAAESRKQAIEASIRRRGGPGVNEEVIRVESEAEVRQRELDLKKGRLSPTPMNREEAETVGNPAERLKRYQ